MKRTVRWPGTVGGLAVAAALVLGGCANGGEGSSQDASAEPGESQGEGPAVVSVKSGELGRTLVDGEGRTLYLFEADKTEKSTCFGGCAKAWPPLLTKGKPKAGKGIDPGLLGSTTRKGGQKEVTYNGHPLYLFDGDETPGDTNGQAIDQFGAEWYVLDADGNKVEKKPKSEKESKEPEPGY